MQNAENVRPITETAASLQDLDYIKKVHDVEGGRDRGPLSEKEVLVYSPMKTGSVSLWSAIRSHYTASQKHPNPERRILHNHHDRALRTCITSGDSSYLKVSEGRLIARDLIDWRKSNDEHTWVVSSFRDPLDRAISHLFGEITRAWKSDGKKTIEAYDLQSCQRRLRQTLRAFSYQTHPIEEIEPNFFSNNAFDHSKKFCHAEVRGTAILVLNLENSHAWPQAFAEGFGWDDINISTHNSVHERPEPVRDLYQRFTSWLRIEKSEIADLYFGQHPLRDQLAWFYTTEEIEGLHDRAVRRYAAEHS